MSDFKGVSERFRVNLINSDGDTERVTVQVGLDGLKILSQDGSRTMRAYDLTYIKNWETLGSDNLVLYTKAPVDLEERQLTLAADAHTIRAAMDTIVSCCMQ
jgi:hypothetical protein